MSTNEVELKKLRDEIEKQKRDKAGAESLLTELGNQRAALIDEIRAAGLDPDRLQETYDTLNTEANEHHQRAKQLLATPAPAFNQGRVL